MNLSINTTTYRHLIPQFIESVGEITKDYIPHAMENITKYEDSQNMTQFILKKIKKIHGHFNKDYVMGFSLLENLRRGPVSARFNGFTRI